MSTAAASAGVEIVGEPADEIAEFWDNPVAIGTVAIVLNIAMIGILYVLFGRVLDPLTVLATGLANLERQTYDVRLPQPHARELAAIADHFNALALALETLRAENLRLNRRLITAQDDERRRTALELHDEVGPCLFGLKANASSIATAAGALPDEARAERRRNACAISWPSSSICRPSTAACSTGCGRWRWATFRSRRCSASSCASARANIRRLRSTLPPATCRAAMAI